MDIWSLANTLLIVATLGWSVWLQLQNKMLHTALFKISQAIQGAASAARIVNAAKPMIRGWKAEARKHAGTPRGQAYLDRLKAVGASAE